MKKRLARRKTRRNLMQAMQAGDVRFAGHVEVVGGFYHRMWEAKVDKQLEEGAWLMLRREPTNVHDKNAIQVLTSDGTRQIGYIAKEKAQELAPFMDIGVKMAARVLLHSDNDRPQRVTARLYIKK